MSAGERVALFSGGGNRSNTNASKALVEFRAGNIHVHMYCNYIYFTSKTRKFSYVLGSSRKRQIQFNGKEKKSGHITNLNLFAS